MKLTETILLRVTARERAEVKRISESLGVAESVVARAALRIGLEIIAKDGLQPVFNYEGAKAAQSLGLGYSHSWELK